MPTFGGFHDPNDVGGIGWNNRYWLLACYYEDRAKAYTFTEKKKYGHAIADLQEAVRLAPTRADLKEALEANIANLRAAGRRPEVLSIQLDVEMKSKVLKKSPPIQNAELGGHSVTITEGWKAEADIRGSVSAWGAELQAGVKAGVEKSTSRTYGVETSKERSVPVGVKKVHVVWVEFYRTGVAKVKMDGVMLELPFEFRDDWGLLTEEAK